MTYIVNDNCINCKYTDCVEVCPVDCFYEGENMLVIHPDECIDCGVCEPECPPEAILPDSEPEAEKWLELNREMSEIWPNIGQKIDAMPDAEKMRDEPGKYEKFFSKAPGAGVQACTGVHMFKTSIVSGLFFVKKSAILPTDQYRMKLSFT